jgi:class 3 adenylate cyclase
LLNSYKSLSIYEAIGNKYGQAIAWNSIGQNYAALSNFSLAMSSQQRALKLSQESKDLANEQLVWNDLSILYEKQGDYTAAYQAYKNYITLRDSIQGQSIKKEITRREIQFEFDKKEATYQLNQRLTDEQLQKQVLLAKQRSQQLLLSSQQLALSNKEKDLQRLAFLKEQAEKQEKEKQLTLVEREKQLQAAELRTMTQEAALQQATIRARQQERNILIVGAGLLLLALFFIYRNFSNQRKSNRLLSAEKQKSDNLLLNILPTEVADELKDKGSATARQFDDVTVLFTDFVKFTTISETLSPTALVAEIDHCFRAFDAIMEKYEMEKIKTIGDAYLAVSGLPTSDPRHAQKAIMAAREICEWVADPNNRSKFEIRIGLNSGPVVAGIVGVKKFAYDIWGDTVNTAARMEQNSAAGKINISGSTYALVKNDFAFVHRGKIEAKNKGAIDMYFLEL